MDALGKYRSLSFSEKAAFWGAVGSVGALVIAVIGPVWRSESGGSQEPEFAAQTALADVEAGARQPADKPLDVAPTALADPEAVPILETSAAEILAQLESVPPLQRQSIGKTYLDRQVRWQGQVEDVAEGFGGFLLVLTEVDSGAWINVSFDSNWRDRLGLLRRGDRVVFEGKIDSIERRFVGVKGSKVALAQPPEANPITSQIGANDHPNQAANQPFDYGTILRGDSPYPKGFEAMRIGTPMSAVVGAYPGGEKRGSKYSIDLSTGPFKRLYASFQRGRPDPALEAVYFWLRDQADRPRLLKAAITTFGEQSMTTESLGAIARWSKFPGIRVQIDEDTYSAESEAPEELAPAPQK